MLPLAFSLAGCATGNFSATDAVRYKPANIYLASSKLPDTVKRVVVLPMACDERQSDLMAGRDELQPIFIAQLIGAEKFEVVQIAPAELERLTGRPYWTGEEVLPADFFASLKKKLDCDAVMFCQLTKFKPYPPMSIGWRLKLVDIAEKKTLWAADQTFVATKSPVKFARLFKDDMAWRINSDEADWLALNSPQRFGKDSLASLFNTLPEPEKMLKSTSDQPIK